MRDSLKEKLIQKLNGCPLGSRYLGRSLLQRIDTCYWFENRFLRAVVRNTGWVEEHEQLLIEAEMDRVINSDQIFNVLSGNDPFYDSKLFDALAEVRLIRWARQNGYAYIEKLGTSYEKTPDFLMKKDEESIIAEAKRFRERDYLPEFVEDWLSGLVLTTGLLSRFGISLRASDKYGQNRKDILDTRLKHELECRQKIRAELSEDWLKKAEALFTSEEKQELDIADGLFIAWRSETPQETGLFQTFPYTNPKVMFDKIRGDLFKALEQINQYVSEGQLEITPDKAIVFLSGTSPWYIEWDTFWETLSTGSDLEFIDEVKKTREEAQKMIAIPFELIVGKDNPLRYVPFPWPN